MARQCVTLCLGETEVKLRLTLRGQKALKEKNPDMSVLAIIMSAVDEPEDMEALLTQALNWEGNKNKIKDGGQLYDELVDNGYCGSENFLALAMDIAKNAGLVTQDEKERLDRAIQRQLRKGLDSLENALSDEESEESSANPPEKLKTLDS